MTATTPRIPLEQAEQIAARVMAMLHWTCERIEVAGSVRRKKADCHDVEIVVIPRLDVVSADLFGNPTTYRNQFDEACKNLRSDGTFTDRLDKNGRPAWGEKYKRALYQGVPVDLFSATSENYGLILALRTGPAEFSLKLVQQRTFGGYLPFGYRVRDGYLWRGDERISTPEEQDVFDAIGLDWIRPENRT